MKTVLLEIVGSRGQILRGVLSSATAGITSEVVVCLSGFERCATTEKKFKILADNLVDKGLSVFRFDFSGTGLSDGDFKFTTVEEQRNDFIDVWQWLKKEFNFSALSVVAHSLGACILADGLTGLKDDIKRAILLAPALNQKELLRYWFATRQAKKDNPNLEATWSNYHSYLNENDFLADCARTNRMSKTSYLNSDYFILNKDKDFSSLFSDFQGDVLHIHGDKDSSVPLESVSVSFADKISVRGGDHDLERPDMSEQWLNSALDFLTKK